MSDSAQIHIRNASDDDLSKLMSFLRPFFEAKYILPRNEEDLQALIRHGFVAVEETEIVGFAAIEIYSRKLAEIQALAVASHVQGQGVGTKLVHHCVGRAKAEGILELMAITSSEELFQKVGFDYSLPNQKRAVFMQTREDHDE